MTFKTTGLRSFLLTSVPIFPAVVPFPSVFHVAVLKVHPSPFSAGPLTVMPR